MKKLTIITENYMEYLVSYDSKKNKERRYCLEVDTKIWAPSHPGDICPEYMLRFCRAKGLADLEWYVGILEETITKEVKSKTTGETVKKVERKRTPSEVKMMFIKQYFPDMKNVKDEAYHGHKSKAKKALEELRAAQKAATKKAANKEQ